MSCASARAFEWLWVNAYVIFSKIQTTTPEPAPPIQPLTARNHARVLPGRPLRPPPQTAADVSVSMQHDFNSQQGGGGFKLNFDVKELNAVIRI